MKFSIESVVAVAVGVIFGVLSLGAVAREQSQPVTGALNGSSNTPVISQVSLHAASGPLSMVGDAESEVLGVY